jgi:hypothetical protein
MLGLAACWIAFGFTASFSGFGSIEVPPDRHGFEIVSTEGKMYLLDRDRGKIWIRDFSGRWCLEKVKDISEEPKYLPFGHDWRCPKS